MTTPNTLRLIREAWIAQLNGWPDVVALGLRFEDSPAIVEPDVESGETRGYVALGDERDNAGVIEAQLVTTVIGAKASARDALDLVDGARGAIIDAFIASEGADGSYLGGLVKNGHYTGSHPVADGSGRRSYHARHFFFTVLFVSPLGHTL